MVGAAAGSALAGVGSLIQSGKAGREAKKAGEQAMRIGQQQLDFNQEQLDDWENMFGGLEQNLSDYYNDLDPTKFATQSKQELQQSMDKQLGQFNEEMASKGMLSSGMRVQAEKEAAFAQAQGNASIDINAPEKVAQMQSGWLSDNRAQQTNAINGMNNAYGNMQGLATAEQARQGASQAGYMGAAGSMLGSAMSLGINSGGFGGDGTTAGQTQSMMPAQDPIDWRVR